VIGSKRVQIGPARYRVVVGQAAIDRRAAEDGRSELLGHCHNDELVITVSPKMAEDAQRDTLLHEVLHAIFHSTGLAHDLGDEKEESMIRRLTPALLDLIRRNPRLVADLMG
jgi:hypothetical protein